MEKYKFEIYHEFCDLQEISFNANLSNADFEKMIQYLIGNNKEPKEAFKNFMDINFLYYNSYKSKSSKMVIQDVERKFYNVKDYFEGYSKNYDNYFVILNCNCSSLDEDFSFGCKFFASKMKNNRKIIYQTNMMDDYYEFGLFNIKENDKDIFLEHYGWENESDVPVLGHNILDYKKTYKIFLHMKEINSSEDVYRIIKQ